MNIIKCYGTRIWSIVAVFWLSLIAVFFHPGTAIAAEFDNTSLAGTYTSMSIGRGGTTPTAGMTIIKAIGNGRFWGKSVVNVAQPSDEPGEEAKRVVLEIPIHGEYEIAEDGSGKLTLRVPEELGEPQTSQFVITEARPRRSKSHRWYKKSVATEIAIIFDKLLPGSNALQTTVLKRRAWREPLNNASFAGTYVSVGTGRGGNDPTAAMSIISADGKGRFVSKTMANRPNLEEKGEREIFTIPVKGKYNIDPDGMGTMTVFLPDEFGQPPRQAHFVVTEARYYRRPVTNYHEEGDKVLLVTQVWIIFDELTVNARALGTSVMKRRGN